MFRIGAFARLSGVSAKMLRAWDAIGLFRPVWIDPSSGYRWYSPAQLPELRRILALRDVGVPLAEIAELVAGGGDLRGALDRRRADLERTRLDVERRLRTLEIQVEMADDADPSPGGHPDFDVVVRPVAAEAVATYAIKPGTADLGPAFYELEAYVRDRARRAPRPAGAIVGDTRHGRAGEIFVPVTGAIEPFGQIAYRSLPGGRAASTIHRGSYASLADARRALARWVDTVGLSPAGPLRIIYLQFGAEPELRVPGNFLVQRDADFVTELQQPVS